MIRDRKRGEAMATESVVFLLDVDNTLLDNDRVQDDLRHRLDAEFGVPARERYWAILDELFRELGYRDYLGALQRYRIEHPNDPHLLRMSSYLVDYPFANRIYPGAFDALDRLGGFGTTVALTDGDVVFQPRKVERSGIAEAVDGRVLIYVHKEESLADVERRFPARHYVLVDDKLRILSAVKKVWGARVTTVFVRQGSYAHDPAVLAANPPADRSFARIGELAGCALADLVHPEEVPP
jgi:FMN phosphatase YigB (HAD superfamily)